MGLIFLYTLTQALKKQKLVEDSLFEDLFFMSEENLPMFVRHPRNDATARFSFVNGIP